MPDAAPAQRALQRRLARYARTPKGIVLVVLLLLLVIAALDQGVQLVAPGVLSAVATGVVIDLPVLRLREEEWQFPDGAIITALIVAMILSPHERWFVAATTCAIGIASKYAFRTRSANVFNPAALGLVVTSLALQTGQSWWGALPELPGPVLGVLFATGWYVVTRVHKVPVVLAFLGTYFALATMSAFRGPPANVAELYRAPDVHAALFFAFFMVTDPPTSPPKPRDQVVFGALTGLAGYAVFALAGAVYFLLAGVLVANVWEGMRRRRLARDRAWRRANR